MMSAIQSEIKQAMNEVTKPLLREISQLRADLRNLIEQEQPEFVTVEQAAKIMGCCTKTMHRRCDEGKFDVTRKAGRKMVRRDSLIKAAG